MFVCYMLHVKQLLKGLFCILSHEMALNCEQGILSISVRLTIRRDAGVMAIRAGIIHAYIYILRICQWRCTS